MYIKGQIKNPQIQRGGNPDFLRVPFEAKVSFIGRESEQITFPVEDSEKIFDAQFGSEFEGLYSKKITIRIHI